MNKNSFLTIIIPECEKLIEEKRRKEERKKREISENIRKDRKIFDQDKLG